MDGGVLSGSGEGDATWVAVEWITSLLGALGPGVVKLYGQQPMQCIAGSRLFWVAISEVTEKVSLVALLGVLSTACCSLDLSYRLEPCTTQTGPGDDRWVQSPGCELP